jgi:hypothetical protein
MALLTECNVSMNKVNNVICTVLQKFTGKIRLTEPWSDIVFVKEAISLATLASLSISFNLQVSASSFIVIDNWLDLSEESQTNLRSMGNFFCKMHLLVNFATECDKALKEFEQNIIIHK